MVFKQLCTFILIFFVAVNSEVTTEEDCQCWEDFKPAKGDSGFHCVGVKFPRIFGCNEDKPPICECTKDGETIKLDLGNTGCTSVDLLNGRYCNNKEEFEKYFKKYPIYATVD